MVLSRCRVSFFIVFFVEFCAINIESSVLIILVLDFYLFIHLHVDVITVTNEYRIW